jgi:hypothetical protein
MPDKRCKFSLAAHERQDCANACRAGDTRQGDERRDGGSFMSLGRFWARGPALSAAAVLLLLAAAAVPVRAQSDYPNRPIRMVVGFAAGGGNDIFARLVGAKLSDIL